MGARDSIERDGGNASLASVFLNGRRFTDMGWPSEPLTYSQCPNGIHHCPANVNFRNEERVGWNLQRPALAGGDDDMYG
jgi:fatty acid desaturase